MKRLNHDGRELYDFNLNAEQTAALCKVATNRRTRNRKSISQALRHVNGDTRQPILNPEFMKNAERAREINAQLGHDRDEVLGRTMALERADEQKIVDRAPIIWKSGEKETAPHVYGSTWFGRFMDWLDRIRPGADHVPISFRNIHMLKEKK